VTAVRRWMLSFKTLQASRSIPRGMCSFADTNNEIVREVNVSTGIINTIAGTPGRSGYSIDNRPATIALLYFPRGVAIDKNGKPFYR